MKRLILALWGLLFAIGAPAQIVRSGTHPLQSGTKLVFSGASASVAPSLVQVTGAAASATSPITKAFTAQPTVGHEVLVVIGLYDTAAFSGAFTVTDNGTTPNTYTAGPSVYTGGSVATGGLYSYYANIAALPSSGNLTVSVAFTGAPTDVRMAIYEVSNFHAIDANGSGTLYPTGGTSLTVTNTSSNTAASDLVLANVIVSNYEPTTTLAHPPSGYTEGFFDNGSGSGSGAPFDSSYKTSGASGTTDAATFTDTASNYITGLTLSLK